MKKVVAIINQKGGVGKTTTSINLSCGLGMRGNKVLLIDLDPQAHSTIGLGVDSRDHVQAVYNVLFGKQTIKEAVVKTEFKGVDVLPAHIHLDRAEQQLTPEVYRESKLYRAIKGIDYDYVVIDCRPTLGTLTVNALYACNLIIVPLEMSRYALEGFADLNDTLDQVKNDNGLEKERYVRILLSKYRSQVSISNDWVMEQLGDYKRLLFNTKIRLTEAINQAHMATEPIFKYDPKGHGSEDFNQLIDEFLTLCQTDES